MRKPRLRFAFSAIEIIEWSFVFSTQRIDDTDNNAEGGARKKKQEER